MAVTPRLSAVYAPDDSSGSRSTRGEFSTATFALKAFTLLHDATTMARSGSSSDHRRRSSAALSIMTEQNRRILAYSYTEQSRGHT
jgi:hypothetical protein